MSRLEVKSNKASFIVPLIAYADVPFHGWKEHKIGRRSNAATNS